MAFVHAPRWGRWCKLNNPFDAWILKGLWFQRVKNVELKKVSTHHQIAFQMVTTCSRALLRGAYINARTFRRDSLFQFDFHMEKLANSIALMREKEAREHVHVCTSPLARLVQLFSQQLKRHSDEAYTWFRAKSSNGQTLVVVRDDEKKIKIQRRDGWGSRRKKKAGGGVCPEYLLRGVLWRRH